MGPTAICHLTLSSDFSTVLRIDSCLRFDTSTKLSRNWREAAKSSSEPWRRIHCITVTIKLNEASVSDNREPRQVNKDDDDASPNEARVAAVIWPCYDKVT